MSNKYSSFKTYKQTISNRKLVNEKFGVDSNFKWHNDPRQFFISLARYKFVAKMLQKKKNVLEIGCGDGFNSRIVKQEVENLEITDNGKILKKYAKITNSKKWKTTFFEHDFVKNKLNELGKRVPVNFEYNSGINKIFLNISQIKKINSLIDNI